MFSVADSICHILIRNKIRSASFNFIYTSVRENDDEEKKKRYLE